MYISYKINGIRRVEYKNKYIKGIIKEIKKNYKYIWKNINKIANKNLIITTDKIINHYYKILIIRQLIIFYRNERMDLIQRIDRNLKELKTSNGNVVIENIIGTIGKEAGMSIDLTSIVYICNTQTLRDFLKYTIVKQKTEEYEDVYGDDDYWEIFGKEQIINIRNKLSKIFKNVNNKLYITGKEGFFWFSMDSWDELKEGENHNNTFYSLGLDGNYHNDDYLITFKIPLQTDISNNEGITMLAPTIYEGIYSSILREKSIEIKRESLPLYRPKQIKHYFGETVHTKTKNNGLSEGLAYKIRIDENIKFKIGKLEVSHYFDTNQYIDLYESAVNDLMNW